MLAGIRLVTSVLSIVALSASASEFVPTPENDKRKSRDLLRAGAGHGGPPGDPGEVHEPAAEHIEQSELYDLVAAGRHHEAFELAFEVGDELFETEFNFMDGVGAYVGEASHRFSRVPRADLAGPGEWASHVPARVTGPNAQACNSCHAQPSDDGAGSVAANVHRDPMRGAQMHQFITRNTPHVFAPGALQRLADELTVVDVTALTVYLAAQPRPTTTFELETLGLIPRLSRGQKDSIARGQRLFSAVGCDSCHKAALHVDDPIFSEPSQHASHRDAFFPAGQDPLGRLLDPAFPITFDLTRDQPDNVVELRRGGVYRLGSLRRDRSGRAVVELFGDLKFHEMGPDLAEPVDETGTGNSVWLTKELWGVGSTGPWLHDGRATTLTEAILAHGGEADDERQAFESLTLRDMRRLVSFLESLVLFKLEEPD